MRVLGAGERQTSYHARNRAAAQGSAEWLVFLDADVLPSPGSAGAVLRAGAGGAFGVLAGAVVDEEPAADSSTKAARYAWLKSSMSQEITLADDQWAFAQTANAAVRRKAFEQVGGFEAGVRSGATRISAFACAPRAGNSSGGRGRRWFIATGRRFRGCWPSARGTARGRPGFRSGGRGRFRGGGGRVWLGGASSERRRVRSRRRAVIGTRRCWGCWTARRYGRLSWGG